MLSAADGRRPKRRLGRRPEKRRPPALTEHRRRQIEDQLAAGPEWSNNGLVLASPVGRPADGTWTTKWFRRALNELQSHAYGFTTFGTLPPPTCSAGAFIRRWCKNSSATARSPSLSTPTAT